VYDINEYVKIPIMGCGGITNWRDAVEFFLAGASVVQVGTAIGMEEPKVFKDIIRGLISYLKKKGYRSVRDLVGKAHRT
jgi:dihydroorotate dehydrogenase (NAD+) catalytic subunit